MEQLNDNINRFLPFGDSLRNVLAHPSISSTDIKYLLRQKGVFIETNEEEQLIPLLSTSLISPFEFESIKEKLKTKEDKEKIIARTIDISTDKNLMDILPEHFNIQEIIKTNFPRYKVTSSPNFSAVNNNPNEVQLDFNCETHDYGKAWYRAKNIYKGKITLRKVKTEDDQIQIQIIHTAPETKDVSDKVVKSLEKHFKEKQYTPPTSEVKSNKFYDFSNEERVEFLLSFTSGSDILLFEKATYIDLGPDTELGLPNDINLDWLSAAQVKDLEINGEFLHKIPFVKDNSLRKFILLSEIEILFKFSIDTVEGQTKVSFGFPGHLRNKKRVNTEFEINIGEPKLEDQHRHLMNEIKRKLYQELERLKSEKYNLIKPKEIA